MKEIMFNTIKISIIYLFAFLGIVFFDAILNLLSFSFINEYRHVFCSLLLCLLCFLCLYGTCLVFYNSKIIYKLILFILLFIGLILFLIYTFNNCRWFSKFKNIEELRYFISRHNNAPFIFILLQLCQVVLLPIPSIIVTGAGVILFGPLKCAVYSSLGVILGSTVAFLLGRKFGYKFVSWFFGKDITDKWLSRIEDKTKIFLIFAFLFPFFPDDTLCALSGITRIKFREFILIVVFTRILSIFISCFTLNNDVIPLNTWWGILLLVVFFVLIFILSKSFILKSKNKV